MNWKDKYFTYRLFRSSRNSDPLKKEQNLSEKGMAIILAVFTVVIISYLAVEISYESNVEYIVNSNSIQRLKAYYAAKSAMQMSLLRIKIFSKIQSQFGDKIPAEQKHYLNMIWSMPFAWPPIIPTAASTVDKDLINDTAKESFMDCIYRADITDEGSKIDITDLVSKSKFLRDSTRRLLKNIYDNKVKNDEDWARKHDGLRIEEVLNNIVDWMDSDTQGLNGNDERSYYADLGSQDLPPNRAFRTPEELKMVKGMTDDLYDLYKDQITVYGMKGINPNLASKEILMSLDPSLTTEVVTEIVKRRADPDLGGEYKDAADFWAFANSKGARVTDEIEKNSPLTFDAVYNFRIKAYGDYKNATREIDVVVFDLKKAAKSAATQIKKEAAAAAPAGSPTPTPSPTPAGGGTIAGGGQGTDKAETPSKGPPRIVQWIEKN